MSYTQYEFTPERHRRTRLDLSPPLRLRYTRDGVCYPPKLHEGILYVSRPDGAVQALRARTGERRWEFQLPGQYQPLPPYDGNVLVGDPGIVTRYDTELFGLDPATGAVRYRNEIPRFDVRFATLAGETLHGTYLDDERTYHRFAYDFEEESVRWDTRTTVSPRASACDGQFLFIAGADGVGTCLDAESGELVWERAVDDMELDLNTSVWDLSAGRLVGIPTIVDTRLVVPVTGNCLVGLDLPSGAVQWNQSLEIPDPKLATYYPDGQCYVFDNRHYHRLDVETGDVLATVPVKEAFRDHDITIPTRMAVTDSFVYFSDMYEGILAAMDRDRGDIVWTYQCDAQIPVLHPPVICSGQLYLVDVENTLYVFEES